MDHPSNSSSGPAIGSLPPEALRRLRDRARLLLGVPPAGTAQSQPAAIASPANANDPAQRRQAERHKTLLTGKVVFNDMASVMDCVVRDMSDTGALIKLAAPVQLPPVFVLKFNDGRYRRCKIRRRAALELGVEFLS